jgi:hypothetical protein
MTTPSAATHDREEEGLRRTINSTYVSLDGVTENPHLWPSMGDDGGEGVSIQTELLLDSDALLMGRRTYEGFAPGLETRAGDPYSDKINSMKKYVFHRPLPIRSRNNTRVIDGDPAAEIRRIKGSPVRTSSSTDSAHSRSRCSSTVSWDELRLWVHPLFVGTAQPEDLLYRDCSATKFDLVQTKALKNGIVILST